MSNATVVVLGAKGRMGRWASEAFRKAGWTVREAARSWDEVDDEHLICDAAVADQVVAASKGVDVIVNALNPPYSAWGREVPRLTRSVIAAAKASGATVIIPGNVYSFGARMPEVLDEATPHQPSSEKGRIRLELEQAYRRAGVKTIIVRAGDFIDLKETGNWFESHIAKRVPEGVVMYPGPRDRVHAWAFLPDLARVMVGLAEIRDRLENFEVVHFDGYNLTGDQLIAAIEQRVGRKLEVKTMPWWALRVLGLIKADLRAVVELRYLWSRPHRLSGTRLAQLLPDYEPTPLAEALKVAVPGP